MEFKTDTSLTQYYLKLVKLHGGRSLTWAELKGQGVTRAKVRTHFANLTELDRAARKLRPSAFRDTPLLNMDLVPVDRAGSSTLLITTAAVGCEVHLPFLKALRRHADDIGAEILVLPCADPASTRSPNGEGKLDSTLIDYGCTILPYQDLQLNDNLLILGVQLSAKQIIPLTGLPRFGNRGVSLIVASPKQSLEFVATMGKHPHALMSTGAITVPDYRSDMHRSKRTSYFAEHDHIIGAVKVEIKSDKLFDFRHIRSDDSGGFFDYDTYHGPRSSRPAAPSAFAPGDFHSWLVDPVCRDFILDNPLGARDLVLNDSFDGATRVLNRHLKEKPLAIREENLPMFIDEELAQWCAHLYDFSKSYKHVYVVRSNHDERIDRYIQEGKFIDDHRRNQLVAYKMWGYMLQGVNPLEGWFSEHCPEIKNVVFLDRRQSFKISGVEISNHGDAGSNGARGGGKAGFDTSLGNCLIGHSHSAGIMRNCMQVGHCCDMSKVDYVKGASSWTKSHGLIWPNGTKQLIHFVE